MKAAFIYKDDRRMMMYNIMASERSTASQFRSYNYSYLPGTNKVNQVSYVYGSNRQGANQITNYSSYVYDANGSVLSSAKLNKTLLMDYDLRSNLVSSIAVNNQYIIDYDYDASGERVYSGMGSSSKIYINSITSNPLTIIDSNDNVTHYIYGPKGIVAKRNESLTYYMLKDHLGSTRVVMNENNQAISSYDYDAWGNPMNSTVSEESAYRYTGREYDDETGLHNFRARLYDSTLMRFYQVDPTEQYSTSYAYCGNNPVTMIDPNGKEYKLSGPDKSSFVYNIKIPGVQLSLDSNGFIRANTSVIPDGLIEQDQLALEAIISKDYIINVFCSADGYTQGSSENARPIYGGYYTRVGNLSVHMRGLRELSRFSQIPLDELIKHEINEQWKLSLIGMYGKPRNETKHIETHNYVKGFQPSGIDQDHFLTGYDPYLTIIEGDHQEVIGETRGPQGNQLKYFFFDPDDETIRSESIILQRVNNE